MSQNYAGFSALVDKRVEDWWTILCEVIHLNFKLGMKIDEVNCITNQMQIRWYNMKQISWHNHYIFLNIKHDTQGRLLKKLQWCSTDFSKRVVGQWCQQTIMYSLSYLQNENRHLKINLERIFGHCPIQTLIIYKG